MSLDSLQKTSDVDTRAPLVRKKTEILCRSQTSGRNLPVIGLRSCDHFTARSLDALCDPEYAVADGQGRVATRYRATTLENLPSATHSDNGYQWNGLQHQEETFENLARGSHRYSTSPSRSPLVIEMAREIEHLKSELAAFQSGQRVVDRDGHYGAEQSGGGMVKNGNFVAKEDVFGDHFSSPMMTDNGESVLIQRTSTVSPAADEEVGNQGSRDNYNHVNFTGDGPDAVRMWSEDARVELDRQKLDVNKLPIVLELRAQVARLQDQLKSISEKNANTSDDVACSANLAENNSASVAHLRKVIQVRNTELLVFIDCCCCCCCCCCYCY